MGNGTLTQQNFTEQQGFQALRLINNQLNQQLVTVEGNVSQSLDKENNYLKQIIEIKDKQIEKLEQDKADHKEEAKQWQEQAQRLLLSAPANNKQTNWLIVAVLLAFGIVLAVLIYLPISK